MSADTLTSLVNTHDLKARKLAVVEKSFADGLNTKLRVVDGYDIALLDISVRCRTSSWVQRMERDSEEEDSSRDLFFFDYLGIIFAFILKSEYDASYCTHSWLSIWRNPWRQTDFAKHVFLPLASDTSCSVTATFLNLENMFDIVAIDEVRVCLIHGDKDRLSQTNS